MTNPNGTKGESQIVQYLRESGFPFAERRAKTGKLDKGDINVDPGVVIEAKYCKTLDFAGWVDQAETERQNADAELGVVWAKRRGKGSPADWYVVMPGWQFLRLLQDFCGVEDASRT